MTGKRRLGEARKILQQLGLPRAQQNDRSALCLLAVLDIRPRCKWADAAAPLIGITPIMEWVADHYGQKWAPNTRETVRRQTMHQFVDAGLVLYNPDDPARAVNSPKAVYQIEPTALGLLRMFGTSEWKLALAAYLAERGTLAARYARDRAMRMVPVRLENGATFTLSPGDHSRLIKDIVEQFAPRFARGARVLYAGDTGAKWSYVDEAALADVGALVGSHGKMPDVVLHDVKRDWLILVEAVTSHGPVDAKRHTELAKLFRDARPGLVFVTAFPSRALMAKYFAQIAWETEVWCADAPSHLIHFDGERFLGPYGA